MRLVRIVLSLLLLAFGLLAAMFLMLVGLLGRIFGRPVARPAVDVRFQRAGARPTTPAFARGDVIDVEATPVKD
jgi:uncharacterized membrane protein